MIEIRIQRYSRADRNCRGLRMLSHPGRLRCGRRRARARLFGHFDPRRLPDAIENTGGSYRSNSSAARIFWCRTRAYDDRTKPSQPATGPSHRRVRHVVCRRDHAIHVWPHFNRSTPVDVALVRLNSLEWARATQPPTAGNLAVPTSRSGCETTFRQFSIQTSS